MTEDRQQQKHRQHQQRRAARLDRAIAATPLHQVPFAVLDIETTGGSPATDSITEIAVAVFVGGERVHTLQTLVRPDAPIAPEVVAITGITDEMVATAPPLAPVLSALDPLLDGTVIVGHNVRFDLAFLNAARDRRGDPPFRQPVVDTLHIARRIGVDEVPNYRLGSLAERFALPHQPSHRAMTDVLATADLLHVLLERLSGWAVSGLDDLLTLPRLDRPYRSKLRLTEHLPRTRGVAIVRDRSGRVLQIEAVPNLRARVRAIVASDDARTVDRVIRPMTAIEHLECETEIEARVRAIRLSDAAANGARDRRRHLRVTVRRNGIPAIAVTTASTPFGPFPTTGTARRAAAALAHALDDTVCGTPLEIAQLAGLRSSHPDAGLLHHHLQVRLGVDALRAAGRLTVRTRGAADRAPPVIRIDDARLELADDASGRGKRNDSTDGSGPGSMPGDATPAAAAESEAILNWLVRNAARLELVECENGWSEPWPRLTLGSRRKQLSSSTRLPRNPTG